MPDAGGDFLAAARIAPKCITGYMRMPVLDGQGVHMMRCASAEVPRLFFYRACDVPPMQCGADETRAVDFLRKTGIGKTATGGAGACADGFIGSGGAP